MTTETLNYVEAVTGRPWTPEDQSLLDWNRMLGLVPLDWEAELLDPYEVTLFATTEPFDFFKELDDFCLAVQENDRAYQAVVCQLRPPFDVAY